MNRILKLNLVALTTVSLLFAAVVAAGEGNAESAAPTSAPKDSAKPGKGPVFVLRLSDEQVDGAISQWNLAYMKRCLERAEKASASLFIVEITTGGGRGDIMAKMGSALSEFKGAPTVGFIKEEAMSAGSYVVLACDSIYMTPGGRIGAATPWVPTAEGRPAVLPSKVEEKFIRAGTVEFRTMAEKKGHSGALAAAMVDPDLEVVATSDGTTMTPMTRDELANARKKAAGRRINEEAIIVKKGNILVMSSKDAVKWGLAKGEVRDRAEILKHAGLEGRRVLEMVPTLGEKVARFCSSGWVVSILMVIAGLALYAEFHKPTGMGAAVFFIALATYFWAQHLAGTAGLVSIIIFLLGLALLLVEVFFIPGFGFAGIGGIVLMLLGMVSARIPWGSLSPPEGLVVPSVRFSGLIGAVAPVFIGAGLTVVGAVLIMRFFPHLPIFNRLILKANLGGAVVTCAAAAGAESVEALLGQTGVTTTKLRPGGAARFGDKLVDVVSDGEFLDAGTPVKIVTASGNRIVVRRS